MILQTKNKRELIFFLLLSLTPLVGILILIWPMISTNDVNGGNHVARWSLTFVFVLFYFVFCRAILRDEVRRKLDTTVNAIIFICLASFFGYVAFFTHSDYLSQRIVENVTQLRVENSSLTRDFERQLFSLKLEKQDDSIAWPETLSPESYEAWLSAHFHLQKEDTRFQKLLKMATQMQERSLLIIELEDRLNDVEKSGFYQDNYVFIRAVTLGALGAMLSLIILTAKNHDESRAHLFSSEKFWIVLISDIFAGAAIAVIVLSLFQTKQLTIFDELTGNQQAVAEAAAGAMMPSFWRVTLLCFIAGAFANKIFNLVADKVDRYTGATDLPTINLPLDEQEDRNRRPHQESQPNVIPENNEIQSWRETENREYGSYAEQEPMSQNRQKDIV